MRTRKRERAAEPSSRIAAGWAALGRAEWDLARREFEAELGGPESAEAQEGLGELAWRIGDEEGTFGAREAAYKLYRKRGDSHGAARMAIALGYDCLEFRGEAALSQGWIQRAQRLLEGTTASAEQGWLAISDAYMTLGVRGDPKGATRQAAAAARLGRRVESVDIEMMALAIQGLAMVQQGQIDEGIRLLDEAATAVVAGEVTNSNATGTILCAMVDACDRIRDFERAVQWCERAREVGEMQGFNMVMALCRPHYAVVLTWRGMWQEAEEQLEIGNRETLQARPLMVIEGIVRLAELRWRQGRWPEADALFEQVKHDGLSHVGRGELALSRGKAAEAADLAERHLRQTGTDDRLARAPGLELLVRALAAQGMAEEAVEVLAELSRIARRIRTEPLLASHALASGVLAGAGGNAKKARGHLEDAVDYYEKSAAPFEAARARIELALALAAEGRTEAAEQAAAEALQTLQRMGAEREAERAAAVIKALGRDVGARNDAAGLTGREREVLTLIAAGKSNAEIAEELVLSVRTVERHISTIYEKIGVSGRAARAAATAYALKQDLG